MAIINITPGRAGKAANGARLNIAGELDESETINVSSDDTPTALPKAGWADFYRIVADAAMYINRGGASVTIGTDNALLPAGVVEYIPAESGKTHITKQDK